jgi:hypothetical protein
MQLAFKTSKRLRVVDMSLMGIVTIGLAYAAYQQRTEIVASMAQLYDMTGPVMLAMAPLTVALLAVAVYLLLNPTDIRKVLKVLVIILGVSVPLGFLGTTLGFMESLSGLEQQGGSVQELLANMGNMFHGVKLALSTTAWGLILLIAGIFIFRAFMPTESYLKNNEQSNDVNSLHSTDEMASRYEALLCAATEERIALLDALKKLTNQIEVLNNQRDSAESEQASVADRQEEMDGRADVDGQIVKKKQLIPV